MAAEVRSTMPNFIFIGAEMW